MFATFDFEANDGLGQIETHETFDLAKGAAWNIALDGTDPDDHEELFEAERGEGVWSIGIERDAFVLYGPKAEVEAAITQAL